MKKLILNALIFSVILGCLSSHFALAGALEVKGCLKQAMEKENPIYQVPDELTEKETYTRYLAILCNKDAAKELYQSIPTPASAGEWSGKTKGTVKILGETGGSSMCYHITRDADGDVTDEYNCSIRLNISHQILGKTENVDMSPFPLK